MSGVEIAFGIAGLATSALPVILAAHRRKNSKYRTRNSRLPVWEHFLDNWDHLSDTFLALQYALPSLERDPDAEKIMSEIDRASKTFAKVRRQMMACRPIERAVMEWSAESQVQFEKALLGEEMRQQQEELEGWEDVEDEKVQEGLRWNEKEYQEVLQMRKEYEQEQRARRQQPMRNVKLQSQFGFDEGYGTAPSSPEGIYTRDHTLEAPQNICNRERSLTPEKRQRYSKSPSHTEVAEHKRNLESSAEDYDHASYHHAPPMLPSQSYGSYQHDYDDRRHPVDIQWRRGPLERKTRNKQKERMYYSRPWDSREKFLI